MTLSRLRLCMEAVTVPHRVFDAELDGNIATFDMAALFQSLQESIPRMKSCGKISNHRHCPSLSGCCPRACRQWTPPPRARLGDWAGASFAPVGSPGNVYWGACNTPTLVG